MLVRSRCHGLPTWPAFTAKDAQRAAQRAERSSGQADAADRRADAGGNAGQPAAGSPGPDGIAVGDDLAVVSRERMGWFRFYFDDQRWEWSHQVQRLHGYPPGTVIPTTELVLSHKHPEDRAQVAAAIQDMICSRGILSSRHRIIDAQGLVHWVVVIGDQFVDADGTVLGTHGFYIDVTPAERARQDLVTARVDEIADNRAAIEQVKGMLMVIYDIDAETAFGVLKWLSQEHNIKLRRLAEQIGTDLRAAAAGVVAGKSAFDYVLITAHQRLAGNNGPREPGSSQHAQ